MEDFLIIKGITAETLLKKFDNLESQIKDLENQLNKQVKPIDREELITRDETAKLLGVSIVTVHKWVNSNVLKAYRIGKKVRFKKGEVFDSLQQIPKSIYHKD